MTTHGIFAYASLCGYGLSTGPTEGPQLVVAEWRVILQQPATTTTVNNNNNNNNATVYKVTRRGRRKDLYIVS